VVGPDGLPVKYGEIRLQDELQFSVYNFAAASIEFAWQHFNLAELECRRLIDGYWMAKDGRPDELVRTGLGGLVDESGRTDAARYPLLAAYDLCLKCSHLFNILDARGAISVTERVGVIARVRALAVGIAKAYVDQQRAEEAVSATAEDPSPSAEPLAVSRL